MATPGPEGRKSMSIAIPFFHKKARGAETPRDGDPATPQRSAQGETQRPNSRRRFRPFVRPAPTVFQRCLATHMYFAARKSALD
jgi:hypothetical protein